MDLKPRISVIVPALLGYESVRAAVEAWEAQSCRSEIEILVLCPTPPSVTLPDGQRVIVGSFLLHEARARAMREARAEHVLIAEDHCLPDRDCIENLLERLDEGWDVIGVALRPGTPGLISEGSFLISYAQWMCPDGGRVAHLPGHNVVLRKEVVFALGDDLEKELVATTFLIKRLRSEGRRLFLEKRARMRHFDVPEWRKTLRIFYTVGLAFGAIRLDRSPLASRLLYGAITPVTAARHFGRGLLQYMRLRGRTGYPATALLVGGVLAIAWSVGESVGALKGLRRVTPELWRSEIKPVSVELAATSR